jgi:hypothetical protein
VLLRCIVIIGLLAGCGAACAADDLPTAEDLADATAQRFPQPVRVGDLIGRRVLEPLESQPTLGWVREVVKEPDGTIAVVMNYGGFLGFFSRPIAVPVNAMVLLGQFMEVSDYEPEQLQNFPDFKPAGTTALAADSIIRVGLAKPSH